MNSGVPSAQQSPTHALDNILKPSNAKNQIFNNQYAATKQAYGKKKLFNGRRGQSVMEMAQNKLPSLNQSGTGAPKGMGGTFVQRRNTSGLH